MTNDGGLSRFQARMRAIPKAVRVAVVPAVVKSAEEMAGFMKHLAPVRTGDLRDSIEVTPPGHSTPPYSQPGGEKVAGELEALITVGNEDVRYAHLAEYGSSKNQAHPFFWPAFRLNRKRAANRIKRAIGKAVRDNWGGK